MSQYFDIHPTHPQQRLLAQAVDIINRGAVIVYPTDSTYALGHPSRQPQARPARAHRASETARPGRISPGGSTGDPRLGQSLRPGR